MINNKKLPQIPDDYAETKTNFTGRQESTDADQQVPMTIEEKWKSITWNLPELPLSPTQRDYWLKMLKQSFYAGVETGMDYPTFEQEWREEIRLYKDGRHGN